MRPEGDTSKTGLREGGKTEAGQGNVRVAVLRMQAYECMPLSQLSTPPRVGN